CGDIRRPPAKSCGTRIPSASSKRSTASPRTVGRLTSPDLPLRTACSSSTRAIRNGVACRATFFSHSPLTANDFNYHEWEPETTMTRLFSATFAALLIAGAAHAQVSLNSVRVGAKDTPALAKFYQTAFGMQETNR